MKKWCGANAIKEMVLLKHDRLVGHLEKQANSGQLFTMNYSPLSIGTQRFQNAKLGINQDAISLLLFGIAIDLIVREDADGYNTEI